MNEKITSLIKELRKRTDISIIECKKALIKTNGDIDLAIDLLRKSGKTIATKKSGRITTEGVILTKIFDNGKFGVIIELNCESDFVAKNNNFLSFGKEILFLTYLNKYCNLQDLKTDLEKSRIDLITKVKENINIRRFKILKDIQIENYLHNNRIGVLVSAKKTNKQFLKYIAMHIAACKPQYFSPEKIPSDIINHEYKIQLEIAIQSGKPNEITKKIVIGQMNKFTKEISLITQPFVIDPKKTVGDFIKENNINITNFIRFELGENI
ncbi:translation elongation factor Ts [Candidatus Providencia siddallii]|uniref:Elongation factor Ts n=1 Tax=Candidatus Providencia siddallii TaxID=1715285 RepID=A0ABM9NNY1_9GAMM